MVDNYESFLSKYRNQISAKYVGFSTHYIFFHIIFNKRGGYFLTDDFNIYCTAYLRSHGWIREQPKNSKLIKKIF